MALLLDTLPSPLSCLLTLPAPSSSIPETFLPPPSRSSWVYGAFKLPPLPKQRKLYLFCSASSGALGGSFNIPISDTEETVETVDLQKPRRRKTLSIAGVDQDELVDPWLLADPDSRFADFYGVQIHYKLANPNDDDSQRVSVPEVSDGTGLASSEPSTSLALPAILLHGFGASLFSWERVLRPLARLIGSKVVAFDRPAFGLTSRVSLPTVRSENTGELVPNPYSIGFSSAATIAFADFLQSEKAILIGHSAGCLVAADAYLRAPERIAAIIMVAPALIAPQIMGQGMRAQKDRKRQNDKGREEKSSGHLLTQVWDVVLSAVRKVVILLQRIKALLVAWWCRLLAAILRSNFATWLLRIVMDKFSLQAVRYAWYNREKIDKYVIDGYTKPLRCRDWQQALLEYFAAFVADPATDRKGSLSERLGEILCPVLVITGDSDGIVPAWNSERIAKALPRAQYRVIRNCGHLPQEEKPEEFIAIIRDFIQWLQQGAMMETVPSESVVFMPA